MYDILVDVPHLTGALLEELTERGLGLELSYFALPEHLEPHGLDAKVAEYKNLLVGFDLPRTMHGAFYDLNIVSREPKIRQVCFERMVESIVIAEELGLEEVVFHTNYKRAANDEGWLARWQAMQVDFWGQIGDIAAEHGRRCLLENTTEAAPHYLSEIARQLGHAHIGLCLDTGHTRCFTDTRLPLDVWVEGMGAHLETVHLHTNRGLRDEHLAFNHPEGVLDFEPFWGAMARLERRPKIVIEVKTRMDYENSYQGLRAFLPKK